MASRGGARPGAGRPAKNKKSVVMHIRVPETCYYLLKTHADYINCSMSELVLMSIMCGETHAYNRLIDKYNTEIKKNKPG